MTTAPTPGRDVMLAYPHPGTVAAGFMTSVLSAVTAPGSRIGGFTELRTGPLLSQARAQITRRFLDTPGLDWLWMVDADMIISDATLPALLDWAHPDAAPVLGAACRAMTGDGRVIITAYKADKEPGTGQFGLTALAGPDELPPDTLIPVAATGAACLLIHRSVFARLEDHQPGTGGGLWWAERVIDGRIFGEDLSFCLRCRDAGVPVHVHTGISAGHMRPVQIGDVTP